MPVAIRDAMHLIINPGAPLPTIVFASPKGGSGKSTSANLLATALAKRKVAVTLIDADPNRPQAKWAKREGKPEGLTVVEQTSETGIVETIEIAAKKTPFVIVDLEGTASQMAVFAISRADLVIIPSQGSPLDAMEAVAAVRVVDQCSKLVGTTIPCAVVLTKTNPAVVPRTLTAVDEQLTGRGVRVFKTRLHERDAYKAIFFYGGTLWTLTRTQAPSLPAAIENAELFMGEVVRMLDGTAEQPKAVA